MTQMLALQEAELSKSSTASKGQLRLNEESQDVPTLLLTRWREKVFSLLVQMKSNELLEQEVERKFAGEKADLLEEVDRLKHEKDLLTCSLEDRTAQLGIEQERVRSLESRAFHLETRCTEVTHECEALQEKLGSLSTLVHCFPVALSQHREMLVQAQSRLVGYERRLDFAHKRIQTFHALHKQITSTEDNLPLNTICSSTQTEQEGNVLPHEEDLKTLSKEQLASELSQVTVERQQLIDHIARLTEEQAEKERVSTEQFEMEVNALRDLLQCNQEERDALSTKCEDLSARLSEVESSKSELVEEHNCLTLEVEELRAKLDQSVQKALLEERGKVKEEFAEMERHLNEVRREHAKMAVILQQTKRDAIRERERLVRSHELEREQLEEEVDTYKAKLSSITAERNLLANVVRQDGRIKSALPKVIHPSPRPLPIQQVVVDSDGNSSLNSTLSSAESRRTYTVNGENNPSEEDVENNSSAVSPTEHVEEQGKIDLYTALQDLQKLSTDLLRLERKH